MQRLLFDRFLPRALLAATLLFCCAVTTAPAADDADAEPEADFLELADAFRDHCVRVRIQAQSFNGEMPAVGAFADDIRHERPTLLGGYWWDDDHVILPDQGLHDRFIQSMAISPPGSDKTYPARLAGRFVSLRAVLLEVLPDENGDTPEAAPLDFIDGDIDAAFLFAYAWEDGEWRVKTDTGLGAMTVADDGVETIALANQGVFIDDAGRPLGLAFGDQVIVEDETFDGISSWRGPELRYTPLFSAADARQAEEEMRKRLADAVLECRFHIRIKVDDDEESESSSWSGYEDEPGTGREQPVVSAAGLVVGRRHILAPLALPGSGIRNIEEIVVIRPDGREMPATFVGACREYQAVVIAVEEDLPIANLPAGFTLLNPAAARPMTAPDADVPARPWPTGEYLRRWRVDYALGRRREVADYDRWLGVFRGVRSDVVVKTATNEEDGSLAFDVEGNLAAVALTPRLINSRSQPRGGALKANPGFRPVDFLRRKLASPDVFDPALVPMDEDQGRRLIDFGVEFQSLDAETSRLFHASRETRGGRIGLLVSHVYPGSIADSLGIREQDVLVRLFVEGRREPMELSAGDGAGTGIDLDMSSESFRQMLQYFPAPWPSRDNVISALLTGAGAGRSATVEYVRDGALRRAEFVTRFGEPDYRGAAKEAFKGLGMTVKPITFEVARYFSRAERSGVIISHVEPGGRSSVAGLHQYLLITRVDGAAVAGMDGFKAGTAAFEEGRAASVELTVEDFGKTRLVKLEQETK